MKSRTLALTLALVSGAALSGPALAQYHGGGHVRFGVTIGVPLYAPVYAPYPYAPYAYSPYAPYYAPPLVVQQPPTTYVQQEPGPANADAPPADWFYCADAKGYYPYVKACPGGWQRVPSRPQS